MASLIWIFQKSYTGGSLISQENCNRRFLDFDLSEQAKTDGSLVLETLKNKNRRLF
jgi:hypothetical protein